MGRKGKGKGQRPIKGFRPGKEPPQLRKQQAKARLGPDASAMQERMIDLVGDRSPREVERMVRRWTLGLLAVVVALVLGGVPLYGWSPVAGIVAYVLAAAALFVLYRLRKHGVRLVELARSIHGGGGRS